MGDPRPKKPAMTEMHREAPWMLKPNSEVVHEVNHTVQRDPHEVSLPVRVRAARAAQCGLGGVGLRFVCALPVGGEGVAALPIPPVPIC